MSSSDSPRLMSLSEACCFNPTTPRLPAVGGSLRWVADNMFTIEIITRLPSLLSVASSTADVPSQQSAVDAGNSADLLVQTDETADGTDNSAGSAERAAAEAKALAKADRERCARPVVIGIELSAVTVSPLIPHVHALVAATINDLARRLPLMPTPATAARHMKQSPFPSPSSPSTPPPPAAAPVRRMPVTVLAEHFSRFPLSGKGDLLFPVAVVVEATSASLIPTGGDTAPLAAAASGEGEVVVSAQKKRKKVIQYISFQEELLRRGIAVVTMARYPNMRHVRVANAVTEAMLAHSRKQLSVALSATAATQPSSSESPFDISALSAAPFAVEPIMKKFAVFYGTIINCLRGDVFVVELTSNVNEVDITATDVDASSNVVGERSLEGADTTGVSRMYEQWPVITDNEKSKKQKKQKRQRYIAVVHLAAVRCPNATEGALYAPRDRIDGKTATLMHNNSLLSENSSSPPPATAIGSGSGNSGGSCGRVDPNAPLHPICVSGMPYDGLAALRFAQRHFLRQTVHCEVASFVPSDKDLANNTQEAMLEQQEHFVGAVHVVVGPLPPASASSSSVSSPLSSLNFKSTTFDGAFPLGEASVSSFIAGGGRTAESTPLLTALAIRTQQQLTDGSAHNHQQNNQQFVSVSAAGALLEHGLAKLQMAPEAHARSPLWREYTLLLKLTDGLIDDERALYGTFCRLNSPPSSPSSSSSAAASDNNANGFQRATSDKNTLSTCYGPLSPSLLQQHQRFCWAADPLQTASILDAGRPAPFPWGHHRLSADEWQRANAKWLNARHIEKSARELEAHQTAEHINSLLEASNAHNCAQLFTASTTNTTKGPSPAVAASSDSATKTLPRNNLPSAQTIATSSPSSSSPSAAATLPPYFIIPTSFFAGTDSDAKSLPFIETFVANMCARLSAGTGCDGTRGREAALLLALPADNLSVKSEEGGCGESSSGFFSTGSGMANPLWRLQSIFAAHSAELSAAASALRGRVEGSAHGQPQEQTIFDSLRRLAAALGRPFDFDHPSAHNKKEHIGKDTELAPTINTPSLLGDAFFWAVARSLAVRHELRYQVALEELIEAWLLSHRYSNGTCDGGISADGASSHFLLPLLALRGLLGAVGVICPAQTKESPQSLIEPFAAPAEVAAHGDDDDNAASHFDEDDNDDFSGANGRRLARLLAVTGDDTAVYRRIVGDPSLGAEAVERVVRGLIAGGIDVASFDVPLPNSPSSSSSSSNDAINANTIAESIKTASKKCSTMSPSYGMYVHAVNSRLTLAAARTALFPLWYPTRPPPSTLMTRKTTAFEQSLRQRMTAPSTVPLKMLASLGHVAADGRVLRGHVSNARCKLIMPHSTQHPQRRQSDDRRNNSRGANEAKEVHHEEEEEYEPIHFVVSVNVEFTAAVGHSSLASLAGQQLRHQSERGEVLLVPQCSPMNFTLPVTASTEKSLRIAGQHHSRGGGAAAAAEAREWLTVHPFPTAVPGFAFGYDPMLSGISLEDVTLAVSVFPIAAVTTANLRSLVYTTMANFKAAKAKGSVDVASILANASSPDGSADALLQAMMESSKEQQSGGYGGGARENDALLSFASDLLESQYQSLYAPSFVDVPPALAAAAARGGISGATLIPLDLANPPDVACCFYIVDVRVRYQGKASSTSATGGGPTAAGVNGEEGLMGDDGAANEDFGGDEAEAEREASGNNSKIGLDTAESGGGIAPLAMEMTRQIIFYVYDENATTDALQQELSDAATAEKEHALAVAAAAAAAAKEKDSDESDEDGEDDKQCTAAAAIAADPEVLRQERALERLQIQQAKHEAAMRNLQDGWTTDRIRQKVKAHVKALTAPTQPSYFPSYSPSSSKTNATAATAAASSRMQVIDATEMDLPTIGAAAREKEDISGVGSPEENSTNGDNKVDKKNKDADSQQQQQPIALCLLPAAAAEAAKIEKAIERQAKDVTKRIRTLTQYAAAADVDAPHMPFVGSVIASATVNTVAPSDYLLLTTSAVQTTAPIGASTTTNADVVVSSALSQLPSNVDANHQRGDDTLIPSAQLLGSRALREATADAESFAERRAFAANAPVTTVLEVAFPLLIICHEGEERRTSSFDGDSAGRIASLVGRVVCAAVERSLSEGALLRDALLVPSSVADDDPMVSRHDRQCLLGDVLVHRPTTPFAAPTNTKKVPTTGGISTHASSDEKTLKTTSSIVSLRDSLEATARRAADGYFLRTNRRTNTTDKSSGSEYDDDCSYGDAPLCTAAVLPYRHATLEVATAATERANATATALATELTMGLVAFDCLNYANAPILASSEANAADASTVSANAAKVAGGPSESKAAQPLNSGKKNRKNDAGSSSATVCPAIASSISVLRKHQMIRSGWGVVGEEPIAAPAAETVSASPDPSTACTSAADVAAAEQSMIASSSSSSEGTASVAILSTKELASRQTLSVRHLTEVSIAGERRNQRFGCDDSAYDASDGEEGEDDNIRSNNIHDDYFDNGADQRSDAAEGEEEEDEGIPYYYRSLASLIQREAKRLLFPGSCPKGKRARPYAHLTERWSSDAAIAHADAFTVPRRGEEEEGGEEKMMTTTPAFRHPLLCKQTFEALRPIARDARLRLKDYPTTAARHNNSSTDGDYAANGLPLTQRGVDRISLSLFALSAQRLAELRRAVEKQKEKDKGTEAVATVPSSAAATALTGDDIDAARFLTTPAAVLVPFSAFPRMLFATHYDHHRGLIPKKGREEARGFAHMDALTQRLRFPRLPHLYKSGSWERSVGTLVRVDPMALSRQILQTEQNRITLNALFAPKSKAMEAMRRVPTIATGAANRQGNYRDDNSSFNPTLSSQRLPFLPTDSIITSANQLAALLATLLFGMPSLGRGSDLGEAMLADAEEKQQKEGGGPSSSKSAGDGSDSTAAAPIAANRHIMSAAAALGISDTDANAIAGSFKRTTERMLCSGVLEMMLVPSSAQSPSPSNQQQKQEQHQPIRLSPPSPAPRRAFLLFGNAPSRLTTTMQSPTEVLPRKMPLHALTRMIAANGVASAMYANADIPQSCEDSDNAHSSDADDDEASDHCGSPLLDAYNYQCMAQHGALPTAPEGSQHFSKKKTNKRKAISPAALLQPASKDSTACIFSDFAGDQPHIMYRPMRMGTNNGDSRAHPTTGGWCVFGDPMASPPALGDGDAETNHESNHSNARPPQPSSQSPLSSQPPPLCVVQYIPVRLPRGADLYKQASYGQVRRDDVFELFMGRMGRSLDLIEYCKLLALGTRRGGGVLKKNGKADGEAQPQRQRGSAAATVTAGLHAVVDNCGGEETSAPADGTFKMVGNAHEPLYVMYTHRRTVRSGIGLWWNAFFPLDSAGPAALGTNPFLRRVLSRYHLAAEAGRRAVTAATAADGDSGEALRKKENEKKKKKKSEKGVPLCEYPSKNPIEAVVQLADAEEEAFKAALFTSCEWLFWLICLRIGGMTGDGDMAATPTDAAADSSSFPIAHLRTYVSLDSSAADRCVHISVWRFTQVSRRAAVDGKTATDGIKLHVGDEEEGTTGGGGFASTDPADQHQHYGLENNVTNRMVTLKIALHSKAFWEVRDGIERGAEAVVARRAASVASSGVRVRTKWTDVAADGGGGPEPASSTTAETFLGVGKRRWHFTEPPSDLAAVLSQFGLCAGAANGSRGVLSCDGAPAPLFPFVVEITDTRDSE